MTDRPKALYEKYDIIPDTGLSFPAVPKHVKENLAYSLRPYQEEAIGRWLHYMDNDSNNRVLPIQLLFNMATGSGKTLLMAALILDLYKRGYRNFIYFVNSTNIIEKTRDNFINPASTKYLFADKILIDGERVTIRSVSNFADGDKDNINILFTTIQKLHLDLTAPRENQISYNDFADEKIVLIGDEAHHNNAKTMLSTDDLEDNRTWEATVDNIINLASEPVLLEFTATMDLEDPSIYRKYYNRIIMRYDLKQFRADGYSKDVLIYHVDADLTTRMLQAIIVSQYRKKVALRHGIYLKPVVLFKSRTIKESGANYKAFNELVQNLTPEAIEAQRKTATDILKDALDNIGIISSDLVEELKDDFREERLILIDGNNISADKQLELNSLEDADNEIRAVFAVDMLNEGWDVLNLFDIVRLYDTRDAKDNKPGKTTIREAQLIGRGARYFPFVVDDPEKKYLRKYDHDESNPLRLIEQLHYHSAHNPKYIQEIRAALVTSGLMDENYKERTLKLKSEFKDTKTYQDGKIYLNERESVSNRHMRLGQTAISVILGWDFRGQTLEIDLPTGINGVASVFDDKDESDTKIIAEEAPKENLETTVAKLIPKHIMRHAMRRNKTFRFSNIKKKMFGVTTADNFVDQLGVLKLSISGINVVKGKLAPAEKLYIAEEILHNIEIQFEQNDEKFEGTEEFKPVNIADIFKDEIKRRYYIKDAGSDQEFGEPQSFPKNPKYTLDLSTRLWYAYDENYGTSEEKSLVKTLDGMMEELKQKWTDIYLLRNEKAFTIYSFDGGRAFEPDFVLLANDKKTGNVSWQIFIEPKGGQLLAKDKWKEDFLKEIKERPSVKVLAENEDIRIIGLPFYNEDRTKQEIIDELRDMEA